MNGGIFVPDFTKKAIKASFWKLLSELPLKQISVRAIAEECGINRNSFYYHFQDIPSLTEEIITDAADALIRKYPEISSIDDAAEEAFNFTLQNKKAVIHICDSVNRDILERYVMRICEYVVNTYFDTVFGDKDISENDKSTITLFVKCEIFGLYIDWINSGMPEDGLKKLKNIITVCNGLIENMIKNIKNAV